MLFLILKRENMKTSLGKMLTHYYYHHYSRSAYGNSFYCAGFRCNAMGGDDFSFVHQRCNYRRTHDHTAVGGLDTADSSRFSGDTRVGRRRRRRHRRKRRRVVFDRLGLDNRRFILTTSNHNGYSIATFYP